MTGFTLTDKQREAQELLTGSAMHNMLFGGSRSGKTFIFCRAVAIRAMLAPESRHAIMRFRFNHVKNSVVFDTWPKMMRLCFPGTVCKISKTDWYGEFANGSQVWFGGLDDKDRTEKILGMEFATGYLNEASQIPKGSRDTFVTRIAQKVDKVVDGRKVSPLIPRMYYDCNPPGKAHWTYKMFFKRIDPDTNRSLPDPQNYAAMLINPEDNIQNLAPGYLDTLRALPPRKRNRFLYGLFSDDSDSALFSDENFETWRVTDLNDLPDMIRIVVAVDPSGSGDTDNADNDEIGIIVAGLGADGNGYILEDCSVKAGPATWGAVAVNAYERHEADMIVGEKNFGGEMVGYVIKTAIIGKEKRVTFKLVTATRGKAVRAEPISALDHQGKIRLAGHFHKLEDEMCGFTTMGYTGDGSPNRADAAVWGLSEIFGGIVDRRKKEIIAPKGINLNVGGGAGGWMS